MTPDNPFMNEIVERSAPRWAWDVIDTLMHEIASKGGDGVSAMDIVDAARAVILASEWPDLTHLPRNELHNGEQP